MMDEVRPDRGQEQRAVRFPISLKLAMFAGALTVLSTVALGLFLTEISHTTLTTTGRDYRLAIADDIADSIRAETVAVQSALFTASELLAESSLDEDARIALLLSHVGMSAALDHVHVYDASGEFIDTIRTEGVDVAAPTLTAAQLAQLRESDRAITLGTAAGELPRTLFATAIRANEQVTGFVATASPMEAVSDRLKALSAERLPTSGATVWVVDRDARVLAVSDDHRNELGDSMAQYPLFADLDVRFEQRIATSAEVEVDGESVVASLLPLPALGWAVAVEVPTEVAYAAVYSMRRSIWIAVVLFLVLAALASLIGARRITRPLKRLVAFSGELAARNFDARASIESRDEVGVLAGVLNGAAQDLKASEEQILRETKIRADLGRYLPGELVDAVVEQRQSLELGGTRMPVTVMFADVVRFTPLCERLPPGDVVRLLNELFTIVTEIIFRHGGTVDKFIGDGIMAFWGAPTPCDDHADRALAAADDIIAWLDLGNEQWREKFGVELELAIGINTGEPIVGNLGSSTRMEYTAIGEPVNVAARLEALARPNQILTTDATRDASQLYEFAKVSDEVLASGSAPIAIWEVLL